jgi:hypothetical protein
VVENKTIVSPGQDGSPLIAALAYAAYGFDVFPCAADKSPLTAHGFKDASRDPEVVSALWSRWRFAEPALAVPAHIVIVDLDRKDRRDGIRDFERLAGHSPSDAETPIATTPSGGLHLFFSASKPYGNKAKLNGWGIDLRAAGGYVVLPAPGNGRQWLKPLTTPMQPAPDWLDSAVKQESTSNLFTRPAASVSPSGGGLFGRTRLMRAVRLIVDAPQGEQEETRHRQCFWIGCLIADAAIDYDVAYRALVAAARAMPAYGKPWRNLEEKVEASLESGIRNGGSS